MESNRNKLTLLSTPIGSHIPGGQFKSLPGDKDKIEVDEGEITERRLRLTKILEGGEKGQVISFAMLMNKLGLWQQYRTTGYDNLASSVFYDVASKALCISSGSLKKTSYNGPNGPVESISPSDDKFVETRLVKFFITMYEEMEKAANANAFSAQTTTTPAEGCVSSTATSTASTVGVKNHGPTTRSRSAALSQRGNQGTTRGPVQPTNFSRDVSVGRGSAAGAPAISSPGNFPRSRHKFLDHQNRKVGGLEVKPDGAFVPLFFTSGDFHTFHCVFEAKVKAQNGLVSSLVLGQIGDYVQGVWKQQFTRTFVSVIYLSGGTVWLLIFAPSKWYQCELGQICHTEENIVEKDVNKVAQTLAKLWFVLTRSENEFGHFCPISEEQEAMKFTRIPPSSPGSPENVLSSAAFVDIAEEGSIKLTNPIYSKVPVCGSRMSRIFRDNEYCWRDGQTRPAILKLSWTPVERLPEGLIYEYLHRSKDKELTDKIPEVYESGIVSENVFGYRVEYIIMEDCGKTVMSYVLDRKEDGAMERIVCEDLLSWLKDAVSIIGYACVHSVLHRDISTGNILIGKKGLKITDWGLAKITKEELLKQKDLAKKWLLTDVEEVAQNEEEHDRFTGTPLFTGIRILIGAKKRGLIDDIESIWYSILYLWSLYKVGVANTSEIMAYIFGQQKSFAGLRVGCISDSTGYMVLFGAGGMPKGELRDFLDWMYKLLFVDDNGAMGIKMIIDSSKYPRDYDPLSLEWLFGKDLSKRLADVKLDDSSPSAVNRSVRVVTSSPTQHRGSTQAEGIEQEELQRSQQPGSNIRGPSYVTGQPSLGQSQQVARPAASGQRSSPLSSNMQDVRLSSSQSLQQQSQSQQQQQQQQDSVQQENDNQSDPMHLLQQQNVQMQGQIAQLQRQIQQMMQRQESGASQDTGGQPNKRQRNE